MSYYYSSPVRRCIRTGFCSADLVDFHDLYISLDEKLFFNLPKPYPLATAYCTKL